MPTSLDDCLPATLRGDDTVFLPLTRSFSGASVHRVDAGGTSYVLKVAGDDVSPEAWRRTLATLRAAAAAGLAPRIVHVDEGRHAVVSEFVVDRSFPMFYGDPRTRDAAIALLARTIRAVHALPLPPDAPSPDVRALFARFWAGVERGGGAPAFVVDAVRRAFADAPPGDDRPLVLSHNDVHPANMRWDGEHLYLVDWDVAGPNHPYYDLAVASLFLRMDEPTCRRLIAAYEERPVDVLPPRFAHDRRLAGVVCGAGFLSFAVQGGHAGATDETLDSSLSLTECYRRMRAGALDFTSPEGQWAFGLALVKESEMVK